jgi:hypothetical protein
VTAWGLGVHLLSCDHAILESSWERNALPVSSVFQGAQYWASSHTVYSLPPFLLGTESWRQAVLQQVFASPGPHATRRSATVCPKRCVKRRYQRVASEVRRRWSVTRRPKGANETVSGQVAPGWAGMAL